MMIHNTDTIPFNESRKMRAKKNLRYLRLIFILFIDIFIYSNVLKNTLSSMKLNTKIQEKT